MGECLSKEEIWVEGGNLMEYKRISLEHKGLIAMLWVSSMEMSHWRS